LTRRLPIRTPFPYTTLFRSKSIARPELTRSKRPRCIDWSCAPANRREESAFLKARIKPWLSRTTLVPPLKGLIGRRHWDRKRRRSEEHTSELQSLAYLVCRL